MTDEELVDFLRRALPRLRLRWSGFRKVRGQVRKRLARRLRELGLSDAGEYESFLRAHPEEWARLDRLCRITISRFYRDRGVWEYLRQDVLPILVARAGSRFRCWSVGCASGEEPYTMSLVWWHDLRARDPRLELTVLATDSDETLLERAHEALYPASSLADLPEIWRERSFEVLGGRFRLHPALREPVETRLQDVRRSMPDGIFELILCRNLVFTYFDDILQQEILGRLLARLRPGGVLVIGTHETLPGASEGLEQLRRGMPVYRRVGEGEG